MNQLPTPEEFKRALSLLADRRNSVMTFRTPETRARLNHERELAIEVVKPVLQLFHQGVLSDLCEHEFSLTPERDTSNISEYNLVARSPSGDTYKLPMAIDTNTLEPSPAMALTSLDQATTLSLFIPAALMPDFAVLSPLISQSIIRMMIMAGIPNILTRRMTQDDKWDFEADKYQADDDIRHSGFVKVESDDETNAILLNAILNQDDEDFQEEMLDELNPKLNREAFRIASHNASYMDDPELIEALSEHRRELGIDRLQLHR